ncbi:MAG: hypothetical protein KTR32_40645 [Granulosicoccus sp.]|nr:hypothetical protein [Granulosicoccus sp.]
MKMKSSSTIFNFFSLITIAAGLLCLTNPVHSDSMTIEPASSWQLRGTANVVVASGDTVFVGGNFTEIYNDNGGSLPRHYLAALNRHTGEPTSFAPNLDGEVWALAMSPDRKTLYVGGSFLKAESLSRKHIAAYNVQTGALTTLVTPNPNGALRTIAVANNKVYIGGLFTKIGYENRPYLAAFDPATGDLDTSFTPTPNARVRTLVATGNRLWIGGDFTQVNGKKQRGVGAVNPTSGALQITDDVAYPVIALASSDTQLFIAGGGPGGRAAAFNQNTGIEQWEISSDGNFQAVDVESGDYVYFGGHYEAIEGNKNIDRLTRHSKRTGKTDLSWLPRLNGMRSINAIDVTSDAVHIGGDFTQVYAQSHEGFATFPKTKRENETTETISPTNTVQGTLDKNLSKGPRWVRLRFNTRTSGMHQINMSWDSDSDVRYNVFNADGTRLSSTVQGSKPGVWSGWLASNQKYYIGLWTMDGVANYQASITAK